MYLTNWWGPLISTTTVTGETSKRAAARGNIFFPNEPEVAITWDESSFLSAEPIELT